VIQPREPIADYTIPCTEKLHGLLQRINIMKILQDDLFKMTNDSKSKASNIRCKGKTAPSGKEYSVHNVM